MRHLFVSGESGSGVFRASPDPQSHRSLFLPREGGSTVLQGVGGQGLVSLLHVASDHSKTVDSNNVSHKLRFPNG